MPVYEFRAFITLSAKDEADAWNQAWEIEGMARHSADFSISLDDGPPQQVDDD